MFDALKKAKRRRHRSRTWITITVYVKVHKHMRKFFVEKAAIKSEISSAIYIQKYWRVYISQYGEDIKKRMTNKLKHELQFKTVFSHGISYHKRVS